ncbi:thioredoxin family protein [Lederbergia lenta]|uniref:thioredoxin family protein n=1 Tax=Lederbergia lenta TaxID=1467 RepID=UPI00203A6C1C|nr:thioredoxin family protein [Lederbergia lenta]MCM3110601.1 thioredoxin family protein [Lederbergia lenta]
MTLNNWYDKAMSRDEYINAMETNKENLQLILNQFEVPADDEAYFTKLRDEKLRVIVLTEDWCGDAMLNIPILLKLAEKSGMEVRMLLRDQNLELMDQYLTNGTARAIPIFIFIDQEGKERTFWGPRAETVQHFVDQQRAKMPPKDDVSFPEKQKEMIQQMTKKYTEDPTVWEEVYQSIKRELS